MLLQKKEPMVGKVILIEATKILKNPAQPRKVFQEEQLRALARSIQQNGLLQPLIVRKNDFERYELISGERRLRACISIGKKQVPCIVVEKSEREATILALVENIQREDLNVFEQAQALKKLLLEWNFTQEQAAHQLGMAQSTVANKLRLLRLTEPEQDIILRNQLTERHARALLCIADENKRLQLLKEIVKRNLNVAQTEDLIHRRKQFIVEKRKKNPPIIKDVRVFINTINKALLVMKQAGIPASAKKVQQEGFIEYTVRIPVKDGSIVESA